MEEVSDEDEEEPSAAKKKGKKKNKKKKKKSAKADGTESVASPILEQVTPAVADGVPPTPTSPTPASAVPKAPATPTKAKQPQPKSTPKPPASGAGSTALPAWASTATLPTYTEQKAQSARTYLQTEGLNDTKDKKRKEKEKRSDRPEEKRSIFGKWAKLRMGRDEDEEETEEEPKPKPAAKKARGLFMSLTSKSKTYLHALLRGSKDEKLGAMKWENFLKVGILCFLDVHIAVTPLLVQVMREMGFTYDPSTAGSSVRFDPPNREDPVSSLLVRNRARSHVCLHS